MAETYFEYCKEASTHFEDYLDTFAWWYLRENPLTTLEVLRDAGMTATEADRVVQAAQSEPDEQKGAEAFGRAIEGFPAGTKEHKIIEDFFFDMMYQSEAGSDFYDEYRHLLAEEAQRGAAR